MEGTVGHLVMARGPGLRNRRQLGVRVHVAGASAILQLTDVVLHPIESLVMALGLECAGVAAAASRTIGRKLPGCLVGVCGVTGRARGSAAMITRIFCRSVYEGQRGPVWIAVARGAVPRGRHVIGDLARGGGSVVAALTVAADSGVIEPGGAPGQRA